LDFFYLEEGRGSGAVSGSSVFSRGREGERERFNSYKIVEEKTTTIWNQ